MVEMKEIEDGEDGMKGKNTKRMRSLELSIPSIYPINKLR